MRLVQTLPSVRTWRLWLLSSVTLLMSNFLFFPVLLTVSLTDSNVFRVLDDTPAGEFVGQVNYSPSHLSGSTDAQLNKISFNLVGAESVPARYFRIDTLKGRLYTAVLIDREKLCSSGSGERRIPQEQKDNTESVSISSSVTDCEFLLNVAVQDARALGPQFVEVQILVIDRNDHMPTFHKQQEVLTVSELIPVHTRLRLPLAVDPDSEKFSVKKYFLDPPLANEFILYVQRDSSRPSDGSITGLSLETVRPLDREVRAQYEFVLKAVDGGSPPGTGSCTVLLHLTDENDSPPVFANSTYRVSITENTWLNSPLLKVRAEDADEGDNAVVNYLLSPENSQEISAIFHVQKTTGEVMLMKALDYDTKRRHEFVILAVDNKNVFFSASTTVIVSVLNTNDEKPHISVDYLNSGDTPGSPSRPDTGKLARLQENSKPPTFVAHVRVSDADVDLSMSHNLRCWLQEWATKFQIQEVQRRNGYVEYNLLTAVPFDREVHAFYSLPFVCTDSGEPALSSTALVEVEIVDVNDNTPLIHLAGEPRVKENMPEGTFVIRVNATDPDSGKNGEVFYRFLSESNYLRIDTLTGSIFTKQSIDRESSYPPLESLKVTVVAQDKGEPPHSSETEITVNLIDENDNPPTFLSEMMHFRLPENCSPNYHVGEILVSDLDRQSHLTMALKGRGSGDFQVMFCCSDIGMTESTLFSFTSRWKFHLNTTRPLDREVTSKYELAVHLSDGLHISTATVVITVDDVNDNTPFIMFPGLDNQTFHLSFKQRPPFQLMTVQATDEDHRIKSLTEDPTFRRNNDLQLDFRLTMQEGHFLEMDPFTGVVSLVRSLTKEQQGRYLVTLIVSDRGVPPREVTRNLFVIVDDSKVRSNELMDSKDPYDRGKDSNNASEKEPFLMGELYTLDLALIVVIVVIFGLLVGVLVFLLYMRMSKQHRHSTLSGSGRQSRAPFCCGCCHEPMRRRAPWQDDNKALHASLRQIAANKSSLHNGDMNVSSEQQTLARKDKACAPIGLLHKGSSYECLAHAQMKQQQQQQQQTVHSQRLLGPEMCPQSAEAARLSTSPYQTFSCHVSSGGANSEYLSLRAHERPYPIPGRGPNPISAQHYGANETDGDPLVFQRHLYQSSPMLAMQCSHPAVPSSPHRPKVLHSSFLSPTKEDTSSANDLPDIPEDQVPQRGTTAEHCEAAPQYECLNNMKRYHHLQIMQQQQNQATFV